MGLNKNQSKRKDLVNKELGGGMVPLPPRWREHSVHKWHNILDLPCFLQLFFKSNFLLSRSIVNSRCSHPEVFLGKGILNIPSKLISIKLLCNFIEIALRHGWSPLNWLHFFRIPFRKNTSGSLLLQLDKSLLAFAYV